MTERANRTGDGKGGSDASLPAWPVETEIYILPSGEVVVADLPAELRGLIQTVGAAATAIECEPYVVDESDQSD